MFALHYEDHIGSVDERLAYFNPCAFRSAGRAHAVHGVTFKDSLCGEATAFVTATDEEVVHSVIITELKIPFLPPPHEDVVFNEWYFILRVVGIVGFVLILYFV